MTIFKNLQTLFRLDSLTSGLSQGNLTYSELRELKHISRPFNRELSNNVSILLFEEYQDCDSLLEIVDYFLLVKDFDKAEIWTEKTVKEFYEIPSKEYRDCYIETLITLLNSYPGTQKLHEVVSDYLFVSDKEIYMVEY